MGVIDYWRRIGWRSGSRTRRAWMVGIEQCESFSQMPAKVYILAGILALNDIDLLSAILSDIADIQVSSRAVEGKTKWIAQAVAPYLRCSAGKRKRVVGEVCTSVPGLRIES